jgi:hypothetical protein
VVLRLEGLEGRGGWMNVTQRGVSFLSEPRQPSDGGAAELFPVRA